MKVKAMRILPVENVSELELVLVLDRNYQNLQKVNKLAEILRNDKKLVADIKQYRKRRSLDANAYCWILADKIAKVIGNTKEFVYQEAIKSVGVFEIVTIRKDAVDRWILAWNSRGVGWQSEVLEDSKLKGYVNTINYFGSSIYDTKAFSLLLEEIIYQAKELGIETMTPVEQAKLMATWGGGTYEG